MFDEVEKVGGVIGWSAWVWKISFTKYMPSIERVQILVVGETVVDGLDQDGVDEHGHGPHIYIVYTKTTHLH